MEIKQRVRLRRNAAYVAELSRRAVERLFAAAGAHAIYDHSALLRIHRDVTTASHHQMVDFDAAAELFGRIELGLEPGLPESVI